MHALACNRHVPVRLFLFKPCDGIVQYQRLRYSISATPLFILKDRTVHSGVTYTAGRFPIHYSRDRTDPQGSARGDQLCRRFGLFFPERPCYDDPQTACRFYDIGITILAFRMICFSNRNWFPVETARKRYIIKLGRCILHCHIV